ncbi:MAG: ParB N-terminal domain-containing protein, partial [Syntrophorhabdales bacterium]
IKVVSLDAGGYRIIYGERRWAAARVAELQRIPCLVVGSGDGAKNETSFIENCHHQSLNLPDYICALGEFSQRGYTNREIARMVGRSESHISKAITSAGFLAAAMAAGFVTYARVLELDPSFEGVYQAALEYKKLDDLAVATQMLEPVIEHPSGAGGGGQEQSDRPDPAASQKEGEGREAATSATTSATSAPYPPSAICATFRREKGGHKESLRWQISIGHPFARRHLGRMVAVLEGVIDVLEKADFDSIKTKSAEEASKIRELGDRLTAIGTRFGGGLGLRSRKGKTGSNRSCEKKVVV